MKFLAACLTILIVLATSSFANTAPTITNITTLQQPLPSGLLEITYDLLDAEDDTMSVYLQISSDGGSTWTLPVTTVSGDVGEGMLSGVNHHLSWDALADYPGYKGTQYQAKVLADDNRAPDGMVRIPTCEFTMGRVGVAEPEHQVYLDTYYLDIHEVTNAQYKAFCDATSRSYPADPSSGFYTPPYFANPVYANYPVVMVSWVDASAFAAWAGKRLPTEAEWERAAKGNTDNLQWPWGDIWTTTNANVFNNPSDGFVYTSPVGSFASGMSLDSCYDMTGNVWEWCHDYYGAYVATPQSNPQGASSGTYRVIRSGSWNSSNTNSRCATRGVGNPVTTNNAIGFRCSSDYGTMGFGTGPVFSMNTKLCPPTLPPFMDDYSVSDLDSCWFWVREDTNLWSLSERSGWLRIRPAGTLTGGPNNAANLMLRQIPDGDWQLETKLEYPTGNGECVLHVYKDDANWINISRQSDGGLRSSSETNDSLESVSLPTAWNQVYLRITKIGTTFRTSASTDSIVWTVVGSWSRDDLAVNGAYLVGLWAGGEGTQAPVDFDYFRVAEIDTTQQSLRLDGSGDYVNCGSADSVVFSNSFAIDVMARFMSATADLQTIVARDVGIGPNPKWLFEYNDIAVSGNRLALDVVDGQIYKVYSDEWTPIIGRWYHLAVSMSQRVCTFYVDGQSIGSGILPSDIPVVPSSLTIGWAEGLGTYFNGELDDIRIWNRPLSHEQIQSVYGCLNDNVPGLLASYHFNSATGNTIDDSGPFGYAGQLVENGTLRASDSPTLDICRFLSVNSPNGGNQWYTGQQSTVRWYSDGVSGNVRVELNRHYPNGTWETVGTCAANNGEQIVQVSRPASTTCRIRITSESDSAVYDISDADFSIFCPPTELPFAENFDSSTLDSCWYWNQSEPTNWSLAGRPGWLEITSEPGDIRGPANENYHLLTRTSPAGDFQIETKVDFVPTQLNHQAALYLLDNEDNFVWIAHSLTTCQSGGSTGEQISFTTEAAAVPTTLCQPISASVVYLRMTRLGSLLIGSYSVDSVFWTTFDPISDRWSGTPLRCGLFVSSGTTETGTVAGFDYFRIDPITGTSVCGDVSGVWDLSGSPYYINCDVSVPAGQTLELQPGVQVLFTGHYKFNILGNLQAMGTEQDSIIFTRAFSTEESKWWGLGFTGSEGISHVQYCRFEYGKATGLLQDGEGGGLRAISSEVHLENCAFRSNTAEGKGGAAYFESCTGSHVSHCSFVNNTQTQINETEWGIASGALHVTSMDSLLVFDCKFDSNQSARSGGAVGFELAGEGCLMDSCEITDNTAFVDGGGIGVSGGSPTIRNCKVTGNTANRHGGGIACEISMTSIRNCVIEGNHASQDGGGMKSAGGSIQRSLFINNSAGANGGGICTAPGNSPSIENSTIYGNNSGNQGGGILNMGSNNKNLIVWGNTAVTGAGMVPSVEGTVYSTIQGGYSGIGNVDSDPLFADAAQGDYRLSWNSPCVDSGDPVSPYDSDSTIADMGVIPYLGPRMKLMSPLGGERWRVFQIDTVFWSAKGVTVPIKVELNRHYPLNTWEVLSDSTANDGMEAFYIADPLSDSCRIRISAVDDIYTDSSRANFRIVSSQGYLDLVLQSQPSTPIHEWNAGSHECPETESFTCKVKNFGSENVVVFTPSLVSGSNFTITQNFPPFFAMSPEQMSTYTMTLTYTPQAEGSHRDTLRIQTDAINAVDGYVRIPLSGSQTRKPASPQIVINTEGINANLRWSHVTLSEGGCPINTSRYLIFFAEQENGPYWFHGFTSDSTYTHTGAVQYASAMFYHVIASTAPLSLLQQLPPAGTNPPLAETQVLDLLRRRGVTHERVRQ